MGSVCVGCRYPSDSHCRFVSRSRCLCRRCRSRWWVRWRPDRDPICVVCCTTVIQRDRALFLRFLQGLNNNRGALPTGTRLGMYRGSGMLWCRKRCSSGTGHRAGIRWRRHTGTPVRPQAPPPSRTRPDSMTSCASCLSPNLVLPQMSGKAPTTTLETLR
jgi:hypothetical protein